MTWTKEKQKKYMKEYRESEKGKKILKTADWKKGGLVVTSKEEMDEIYERYLASERCEKKRCEYSEKNWKCMDHEHSLGDFGPFRNIICNSCNLNDKVTNTSGTPNICKNKNGWIYSKMKNRKKHYKWFKTKEEAIDYKIEYESIQ